MNSTNIEPTPAELERQKDAFIEKLIEIVRKQEKPPIPEKPKEQNESG
jgi:glycine cleavage system protein P-like pyridoxal-binding family